MPRTPKQNGGYVIQRGTSPIDGNPFVVILTTNSSNRKTGNMCQVWILREDVNPVEAVQTGSDLTICGDCPHRKQADGSRSCYVNVGQAPLSVWRAYKAGRYIENLGLFDASQAVKGREIRWGAYGDPALVDPLVFRMLNLKASGHTAYTHQWRKPWGRWTAGHMQASCDSFREYLEASAQGWRTFAVIPKRSSAYSGKQCPATVANSSAQCRTCQLCDGATADVFVEAHGSGAKYITA